MSSPYRPFRHRIAATFFAVWFVLVSLVVPSGVGAQVVDPAAQADRIRAEVQGALRDSFKFQLQLALVNALQFFGQRIAYDVAVEIASGGKAQSALFDPRPGEQFWRDTFLGTGLQFVNDLDRSVAGPFLGFDSGLGVAQFICAPTLPEISLKIKLGLQNRLNPVQPLCSWQQFSKNWKEYTKDGFGSTTARVLSGVGVAFEPGESDLSAALELHLALGEQQAQIATSRLNDQLQNQGFKPVQDFVSGMTRTPASVVEESLHSTVTRRVVEQERDLNRATAEAVGQIDSFFPMLQAAGQALAVNFAATIVSQTLQRQLFDRGLLGGPQIAAGIRSFGDDRNANAAPPAARREAALASFAELQRPQFTATGNYDQLAELSSCDPNRRQLTTCALDGGFTQAIRQAQNGKPMTVADALAANLLHRDWPLIPTGTAKDQDPNCALGPPAGGYCASNLAKLRRARILPIGWELAANHEANERGNPKLLGEVVDAFAQNGDDGICGTRGLPADSARGGQESPFCGLIDSNWILRYVPQQCRLRAPGELLLEQNSGIRADTCTDAPSCLALDGEQRCVGGYGYCVRERNTWQLSGKSCPASAASCRAFTGSDGSEIAVLASTVDRAACTAETAGCKWYATRQIVNTNDAAVTEWVAGGDRRYLNRNLEQCQASDEGCTELLPVATAQRNEIRNGSFAIDEDAREEVPDQWDIGENAGKSALVAIVDAGFQGRGVRITGVPDALNDLRQTIPLTLESGATYTASVRFKASANVRGKMFFGDDTSGPAGNPWDDARTVRDGGGAGEEVWKDGNGDWQPLTLTVVAKSDAKPRGIQVYLYAPAGSEVLYDEVQVELGDRATAFHEGYAPQAPKRYLKLAPADQRCDDFNPDGTRNTTNDGKECGKFALACTADDVGCERFTPTDGSPIVTGRYTDTDRCPAACVGYAAFREEPSTYGANEGFDYFIPSSARACTSTEVGCSEFTNLDAATAGGESREFFTALRRCVKPGTPAASSATYYIWEGSQDRGLQLQSFLLQTSINGVEGVNSPPWTPSCGKGNCAADSCEVNYGKRVGEAGYDAVVTPDCRAFYSQNGAISYRRLSKTILVTDQCTAYRLTHAVTDEICTQAGGEMKSSGCVIGGYRPESSTCTQAAVGCRAYRGNASGAVRTLIQTDFEQVSEGNQGWSRGDAVAEAVVVGGRSLSLAGTSLITLRTTLPDESQSTLLRSGSTYELLVVGKGTGTVRARLKDGSQAYEFNATGPDTGAPGVTFGTSWQRIAMGPLILTAPIAEPIGDEVLEIEVANGSAFFDQIILRETPEVFTRIKRSWVTPTACDRASIAPDAAPQPQGMLGCRAFRDRAGNPVALRSFAKLCSADVVGCTAFSDTRNSTALDVETFNGGGDAKDDVTVPADTLRYVVDDAAKSCQASARSCRQVGVPTLDRTGEDANGVVTGWTGAFVKDDPDRYRGPGAILCTAPALGCEEYRGQDGGLAYFRAPGNRTCTFRENVTLSGGVVASGWFRTGTDVACDSTFTGGGAAYGIWRNADPQYGGWVGTCSAAYDQCTEFRDPTERTVVHPAGVPYYALRESVDLASCSGNASQRDGCVVLDDTSRPNKTLTAAASYADSDAKSGARVPAIDCEQNSAACRRCTLERKCRSADGVEQQNGPSSCLSDNDCKRPLGFTCRGGDVGVRCTAHAECRARGAFPNQSASAIAQATCAPLANDGNVIVKVDRDRACSQWLACVSTTEVWDPAQRRLVEVCDRVDRCDAYRPSSADSQSLQCAHWVSGADADDRVLDRAQYQQRDRTWRGQEYSGYSIPGVYQVPDLELANLSTNRSAIDQRLVRVDAKCWTSVAVAGDRAAPRPAVAGESAGTCKRDVGGNTLVDVPGTCDGVRGDATAVSRCGDDGRGLCVNHRCVYGVDGKPVTLAGGAVSGAAIAPTCRAYPETNAPFPEEVAVYRPRTIQLEKRNPNEPVPEVTVQEVESVRDGYQQANICAYGNGQCGCAYEKVKYPNATQYIALGSTAPTGFCDGGFTVGGESKTGIPCARETECADARPPAFQCPDGTPKDRAGRDCGGGQKSFALPSGAHGKCQLRSGSERFLGISGICLERDASNPDARPCVAWLPVQQLAGGVDMYNQFERAGFREEVQYCADVTRYEYRKGYDKDIVGSCTWLAYGAICGTVCTAVGGGPQLAPVNPAFYGCMYECTAGAGIAAAAQLVIGEAQGLSGTACGNPNYHAVGKDLDFEFCGIIPSAKLQFRCRPKGDEGWYADPDGSKFRDEDEAYRCTEVVRAGAPPTPEETGNAAWTDRVRTRANPEEVVVLAGVLDANRREDRPMTDIGTGSSCGLFGRLPNVSPEKVGVSRSDAAYWEVFTEANLRERDTPPTAEAICSVSGVVSTNHGPAANVAGALRHFEDARSAFATLFAAVDAQWSWQRFGEDRRCLYEDSERTQTVSGDRCTDNSTCRDAGRCQSICQYPTGRCAGVDGIPKGAICNATAPCRTLGETCTFTRGKCTISLSDREIVDPTRERTRGDATRLREAKTCTSKADCTGGDRDVCEFPVLTPLVWDDSARVIEQRCGRTVEEARGGAVCVVEGDCVGEERCQNVPVPLRFTACQRDVDCVNPRQEGKPTKRYNDLTYIPDGVCGAGCTNSGGLGTLPCTRAGTDEGNTQCTVSGRCAPPSEDASSTDAESGGQFREGDARALESFDVRAQGSVRLLGSPQPQLASVTACTQDEGCRIERIGTFSVNGFSSGPVRASGGLATLQFYGWASRNQMPITDVAVDWGDGTTSGGIGKYQNHKPFCASGESLETSVLRCSAAQELTCVADADCPSGAGRCVGEFCRLSCTGNEDCPSGSDCAQGACIRKELAGQSKRCRLRIDGTVQSDGSVEVQTCERDADCPEDGNACISVAGSAVHLPKTCPEGANVGGATSPTCAVTFGRGSFTGTCVGATSFGNFPDACTTTPFAYRHTYACAGPSAGPGIWDESEKACVFTPRVKLIDNWRWCTGSAGARGQNPQGEFCDTDPRAFVTFGGRVLVKP